MNLCPFPSIGNGVGPGMLILLHVFIILNHDNIISNNIDVINNIKIIIVTTELSQANETTVINVAIVASRTREGCIECTDKIYTLFLLIVTMYALLLSGTVEQRLDEVRVG